MAKKKEEKKITVEALCRVTASQAGISEEIRKFDKSWALAAWGYKPGQPSERQLDNCRPQG
jgi:hypothetical protein